MTPEHPCAACGGAAHPASGCQYSERVLVCGPCTRRFWVWARQHMHARKGQPDFYAAAALRPVVVLPEKSDED